jgi:hypothetical protein
MTIRIQAWPSCLRLRPYIKPREEKWHDGLNLKII